MRTLPAAVVVLLALSNAVELFGAESGGECEKKIPIDSRPHSVSIVEFGAVGDGKTLNTLAFQNAIFYLKSFADKGGAQLYVPQGRWLTGSFNLTSHLTLFLEKGAVIIASQDPSDWDIVDPLPSYGRGVDVPGKRYRSLINGYMLHDVVITGDNGTVDGQGSAWWDLYASGSLNYSRPHLVEFISCNYTVVSNITFLNSPSYSIHPVYSSNVLVRNLSIYAPPESRYTVGIVPDSSDAVCIEDCSIGVGFDAISLKSGWDEYGISYGRSTTNVHVRRVGLQATFGSCLAFGSEMSGGISDVLVEHVHISDSNKGLDFRTARGRGGYITEITASDIHMENVNTAFSATGQCDTHPDDKYDPDALPSVSSITLRNITGTNISFAGNLTGISGAPFTGICLSDISLSIASKYSNSSTFWVCSYVSGISESVFPEPCPELESGLNSYASSTSCFSHRSSTTQPVDDT
uniref:Polygalacturonase n=1 Tax=Kalanchoe fedtschenkoi TaxID=63787 RepID=A0A7N0T2A6_KALFE